MESSLRAINRKLIASSDGKNVKITISSEYGLEFVVLTTGELGKFIDQLTQLKEEQDKNNGPDSSVLQS